MEKVVDRRWLVDRNHLQKYGPIVRIGPNRVAVADPASVREIYRTHAFRKGDAYSSLTFGGTQNSWITSYVLVAIRFRASYPCHPLTYLYSDIVSLPSTIDFVVSLPLLSAAITCVQPVALSKARSGS